MGSRSALTAGSGGERALTACSDGVTWPAKVRSDNNRLEIEGEVDSDHPGQRWSWRIKDNGTVAATGSATTGGRSWSFSVEGRMANGSGADRVGFRATRAGEAWSGAISR